MLDLVAIIGLGFLLGMRHATDPDHVIAVTTIVTRERDVKQAALIGMAWGAGHTLTILAVGSALITFRLVLPPRAGLGMELAVAVMLILLGIRNMGGLFGSAGAAGQGHHGHPHPHVHESVSIHLADRSFGSARLYCLLRPLVIGVVHGLAGSAAIALLVLSTIHNSQWAVMYLLIFGIGTVLGMMVITTTTASALRLGGMVNTRLGQHFRLAAGVLSVAFGLFLTYQIGFVHGLFMAHANWVPR